jgi:lipoprotein-anchoring transpeptidase ErfK/SrfK
MTGSLPARTPMQQAVLEGCDALARGDRASSRASALRAVALDPRSEEAWLLLAALASPRTRSGYLDHLLLIHPESRSARHALEELATLRTLPPSGNDGIDLPSPEEILRSVTPPAAPNSAAANPPKPASPPRGKPARKQPSPPRKGGVRWGVALLAGSCLLALTATAFAGVVSRAQEIPVIARVAKNAGTEVPSFTPSFTPTITPSFTPTFTLTSTPSPTNTPTATLPPATAVPYIAIPGSGGERWIDVDISSQRVSAYEGNTLIRTFIVSTGTSAHPTVQGRFRIYVKYRYSNMAGPGYYLPNVPFTMYFYEGYSIHGTYWHHNFGTPMSHGCVNMETSEAEWMYYFASVGTVVNVHW